jgi:hypothetical protein
MGTALNKVRITTNAEKFRWDPIAELDCVSSLVAAILGKI